MIVRIRCARRADHRQRAITGLRREVRNVIDERHSVPGKAEMDLHAEPFRRTRRLLDGVDHIGRLAEEPSHEIEVAQKRSRQVLQGWRFLCAKWLPMMEPNQPWIAE